VRFGADYREVATLRDGASVVLRPIRPDDKDLLARGFARLSPHSRYLRFFTPKACLTDDELRYLTELDGVTHFALGATTEDERDGLGVARFIQLAAEPGVAEAAIAVIDDMHGKGLGSLLFERLVAAAAERGVERVRCHVLGSNTSMQDFLRAFSPVQATTIEGGVVTVEMPLGDRGMYELLRQAAAGAITMKHPPR
jgi:GNAT superfamily N-acetyltransferase